MTIIMLRSVMDALISLGVRKGTKVRLSAARGMVVVYIGGERFGIYDTARKTFVD